MCVSHCMKPLLTVSCYQTFTSQPVVIHPPMPESVATGIDEEHDASAHESASASRNRNARRNGLDHLPDSDAVDVEVAANDLDECTKYVVEALPYEDYSTESNDSQGILGRLHGLDNKSRVKAVMGNGSRALLDIGSKFRKEEMEHAATRKQLADKEQECDAAKTKSDRSDRLIKTLKGGKLKIAADVASVQLKNEEYQLEIEELKKQLALKDQTIQQRENYWLPILAQWQAECQRISEENRILKGAMAVPQPTGPHTTTQFQTPYHQNAIQYQLDTPSSPPLFR